MIGRTNTGGGLGKSTLIVQTESGSEVTVSNGAQTRKAVERYGVWVFPGLSEGEWTVRAEKDGIASTKTVTMDGTSSLTLILYFNQIPTFTYTGECEIVDDWDSLITTSQGNWKIRFLTSGTLTFTELRGAENGIDVFLVGGGAGSYYGAYSSPNWTASAGAGSGYTTTVTAISVVVGAQYSIVIGSGGTGGILSSSIKSGNNGGNTAAFGLTAQGGYTGTSSTMGGNGGSGGAGYSSSGRAIDGADGPNGEYSSWHGGKGQGTTTREFGESSGRLYASGGIFDGGNDGTDNTGDGADGAHKQTDGRSGGSGIVIIRNTREVT